MMDISVVLPAYNEKDNIGTAIRLANGYLKKKFKTYEIVVVNDGATDGTKEIVEKLMKTNRRLKLINHVRNMGYGAALRSGFENCSGRLIFYTDSDNQYDISELDKFVPLAKKYDIVAGYRVNHQDPLMRIIISKVYNFIVRILLGLKIKDVDCSFKLYKREVFNKIKLRSKTGLIDAEILIKAQKAGFSICQLGVNHYPRLKGRSIYEVGQRNRMLAFIDPRVPIEIFKEIRKLWSELH